MLLHRSSTGRVDWVEKDISWLETEMRKAICDGFGTFAIVVYNRVTIIIFQTDAEDGLLFCALLFVQKRNPSNKRKRLCHKKRRTSDLMIKWWGKSNVGLFGFT